MKEFPPNINPEYFSLLAVISAYVYENDYNANELNSIGNWLILLGQFLLTTAAQQQLINARYSNNTGSNIKSDSDNHYTKNKEKANKEDLDNLKKIVDEILVELKRINDKYSFIHLILFLIYLVYHQVYFFVHLLYL